MDVQQTMQNFWSGFGVPAYDENSVPDDQYRVFPHITYDVVVGDTMDETAMSASIWTRSSQWISAIQLHDAVNDTLSNGGVILPCDTGGLWIKKASPWAQRLGDASDGSVKRILLNISVEFVTRN